MGINLKEKEAKFEPPTSPATKKDKKKHVDQEITKGIVTNGYTTFISFYWSILWIKKKNIDY